MSAKQDKNSKPVLRLVRDNKDVAPQERKPEKSQFAKMLDQFCDQLDIQIDTIKRL